MNEDNKTQEKTPSKRATIFPSMILIVLGACLLAANFLPNWHWAYWWPIFVLAPGFSFFVWYFAAGEQKSLAGILIPASILTFLGLFFFIMNSVGWRYMEFLWPTFVMIVGLSFFVTYFGSQKTMKALIIPGSILCALALIFYVNMIGSWKLWPLILIAIAIFMLFRRK